MKKNVIQFFAVLSVIFLVSLSFAADERIFKTDLTGKEVMPSVKTKAKGEFEIKVIYTGKQVPQKEGHHPKEVKELKFKLMVTDIEDVTAAHIHKGRMGENGLPVVNLYTGPKKQGKFNGMLSEGIITEKDLFGPLKGKSLDQLIFMIEAGHVYVNVHTSKYPDGEVRGVFAHMIPGK